MPKNRRSHENHAAPARRCISNHLRRSRESVEDDIGLRARDGARFAASKIKKVKEPTSKASA